MLQCCHVVTLRWPHATCTRQHCRPRMNGDGPLGSDMLCSYIVSGIHGLLFLFPLFFSLFIPSLMFRIGGLCMHASCSGRVWLFELWISWVSGAEQSWHRDATFQLFPVSVGSVLFRFAAAMGFVNGILGCHTPTRANKTRPKCWASCRL